MGAAAFQQLARPVQLGLECAFGDPQDPRGFGEILFFKVVHQDRIPIALGEGQHGTTHTLGALALLQVVNRTGRRRQHAGRVEAEEWLPLGTEPRTEGIDGDGDEPGRESGLAAEGSERPEDFDEDFLGHVLRGSPVAAKAPREADEPVLPSMDDGFERGGISRNDPCNIVGIRIPRWHGSVSRVWGLDTGRGEPVAFSDGGLREKKCNRHLRVPVSSVVRKKKMTANAALFLFLAAAVVAVFAFASIVVWVSTPARERQARDRLALLKALVDNPSEQAREVLNLLREEDATRAWRRAREERRGWVVGGLILIVVAVGLGIMLALLGNRDAWSVAVAAGLIPFLIGCVLLGIGLVGDYGRPKSPRGDH